MSGPSPLVPRGETAPARFPARSSALGIWILTSLVIKDYKIAQRTRATYPCLFSKVDCSARPGRGPDRADDQPIVRHHLKHLTTDHRATVVATPPLHLGSGFLGKGVQFQLGHDRSLPASCVSCPDSLRWPHALAAGRPRPSRQDPMGYVQTNLVSDLPGMAQVTDTQPEKSLGGVVQ